MATHERAADNAITPRCPACQAPLPRIAHIPGGIENSLAVNCPACHMVVTFQGAGLILDRRLRSRAGEAAGAR